MRKLSAAEIERELSDIARWPTPREWIFMKNIFEGRTGYMLAKTQRDDKPIILKSADKAAHVEAPSLRDLIAEGWVVD